jgi:two-component system NtrC family sensor kinase
MRISIKTKLIVATFIPLLVAISICWLTGFFIHNSQIAAQAKNRVRNNLNTAREVYLNEISHIRDVVKFTAAASYTADAISRRNMSALSTILTPLHRDEHLNIFTAVDANGKILYRANNPQVNGDVLLKNQFVDRALKGEIVSGTSVFSSAELSAEGKELVGQASIKALSTGRSKPGNDDLEQAGMVMESAAPVRDETGKIVGALYGGVLVNNNNRIVDKIKNIVFDEGQSKGRDVGGGATIFLGDVRIATNVITSAGVRAIGTRLSEEVYNRVIINKEKWIDRAFVVEDWYITAYEPILSLDGTPIGCLYVGVMETPYTAIKYEMAYLFSGVLLLGSLIGTAISGAISSRLAKPINELENTARRVASGERNVEIAIRTRDEIGDLARAFNEMTRTLSMRERNIRELNSDLELKVSELEEKHQLLVKTKQELVRAEKLAAIGELAAGVAHEINNPMAIIRGNVELLQMSVSAEAENREEVDTIYLQVGRVERIVSNLIKFARQEQTCFGGVDINRMLHEILTQVRHQIPLTGITSVEQYDSELKSILGDSDQLQQVFTNLVINGIQSMQAEGGTLTLGTLLHVEAGVCEAIISDTGSGIAEEILEQIFNPFFTTKKQGVGLGLSISYGIIKEHGGRIDVQSEIGKGTTFRVVLPVRKSGAGL